MTVFEPTRTRADAGQVGESDDDLLRRLLADVADQGWDSSAGQELLALLAARAPGWAGSIDRHCQIRPGSTAAADVLSLAWETLATSGRLVAAADAPWAYLWHAVRKTAAVDAAASTVLGARTAARDLARCRTMNAPLRVGLAADPAFERLHQATPRGASMPETAGSWSPALEAFLQLLVDRGACPRRWRDAVDRAVQVLADSRDSYREHDLRRDPYLRLVVGLQPRQLSALAGLLIGTRRGDRAAQSLLRALHADPATDPATVHGASDRLRTLLEESPNVAAGMDAEPPVADPPWLTRAAS